MTNTSANNDLAISETLNMLKEKGYSLTFRREATCLYCFELNEWITPAHFTVDNYHYNEDSSTPDAQRIVYAISLLQGGKGYLIDSCYAYVDNIDHEMMQKLKIELNIKDKF